MLVLTRYHLAEIVNALLYALPFTPLLVRLLLILRFPSVRGDILREEEHDRPTFRTNIFGFAGFSFTALAAMAVIESRLQAGLSWTIYYLVVSFFSFMFALNYASYKARRWEDQVATGLIEVGTLALFGAIVAVLFATRPGLLPFVTAAASFVWLFDHMYRIHLDWQHHRRLSQLPEEKRHA